MVLPTVISAYKSLATAQKLLNIEKAKQNALDEVEATLKATNLKGMTQEQIIETAQASLKEKKIVLSKEEITTRLTNVGLIKAETNATVADTTAKTAESGIITTLTAKMHALNAAIAANPLIALVTVATLAVSAISIITNKIKANTEAMIENNKANIEEQDAILAQVQANEELYKVYTDTYNKYIQGKVAKEDLSKATDDLTSLLGKEKIAVAELTGDYSALNEEIARVRKEAAQEGLLSAQSKLGSVESNLALKAREG